MSIGPLSTFAFLGGLAALLQAGGYALYLRHALRAEARPNAASWLMFAYGTTLVVVLEATAGASWPVLLLPAVCAASSVLVAARSFQGWSTVRNLDRADLIAFALDLAITLASLGCWLLKASGIIGPDLVGTASAFLLAGAAVTSVTAFVPIIRSTYAAPERERPVPWGVWTAAYAVLGILTLVVSFEPVLLIYPAVNVALHGTVCLLSARAAAREAA